MTSKPRQNQYGWKCLQGIVFARKSKSWWYKRALHYMLNSPFWIGHFRVHLSLHFKARLSAKSLLWKSVFIHIEIGTYYHNKSFALRLALKERLWRTRKWSIEQCKFRSKIVTVHVQRDAVSLFTRQINPYRFENAPLLAAFSSRPGFANDLDRRRVNRRRTESKTMRLVWVITLSAIWNK